LQSDYKYFVEQSCKSVTGRLKVPGSVQMATCNQPIVVFSMKETAVRLLQ